jgi:hypothetical protein
VREEYGGSMMRAFGASEGGGREVDGMVCSGLGWAGLDVIGGDV